MSDHTLRGRSFDYAYGDDRDQGLDARLDTSLEWFSPISEKKQWTWRRKNTIQSQHSQTSKKTEVEASDLQAGLANAILILKEEVARNHALQEVAAKDLANIADELIECDVDLDLALKCFKGTFLVVRSKARRFLQSSSPIDGQEENLNGAGRRQEADHDPHPDQDHGEPPFESVRDRSRALHPPQSRTASSPPHHDHQPLPPSPPRPPVPNPRERNRRLARGPACAPRSGPPDVRPSRAQVHPLPRRHPSRPARIGRARLVREGALQRLS